MIEGMNRVLQRVQELQERFGLIGTGRQEALIKNGGKEVNFREELKTEIKKNGFEDKLINGGRAETIGEHISQVSKKYNVPEALIKGIIKAESNFNEKAVSKKGAKGLMQILDSTSKELDIKNVFDVYENVEGGVKYFRRLLDRFEGNLIKSLAAYNAGPEVVERHGIPNYRETNKFVERVLKYYRMFS